MKKAMRKLRALPVTVMLLFASCPLRAQEVEYVGSYAGFGYAEDVFVAAQYAYVADYDSCLMILDISDVSHPSVAAAYGSWGYWAVNASGYCALMAKHSLVEIIDVSDPANPELLWSDSTWEDPVAITVHDNYAYISMFYVWDSSELRIFDISEPADPVLMGACDLGRGFANAIFLSGDYAFIASEREGLVIVNIDDPYDPGVVGSYWTGYGYYHVYVCADHAYLPKGNLGLEIVDVSVPSDPSFVSIYDTEGSATDVGVLDNYAYIADGPAGLQIIDVTDPANPAFVAGLETQESVNNIFLAGGNIFLMDRNSLLILHFDPQTGIIEEIKHVPTSISLSQNYPNPFNASTTIRYDLPVESDVTLDIYDILGRKLETLVDQWQAAGSYIVVWDADQNSSGLYFYKLWADGHSQIRTLVLIR